MTQLTSSAKNIGTSTSSRNDLASSDVVEVSLLIPRSQIMQLANQAHRRGMTSAQFLRQCITSVCQGNRETA